MHDHAYALTIGNQPDLLVIEEGLEGFVEEIR
jgi:hypothetical protein